MLKFILSHWGIFSLLKLYPFVLLLFIIPSQYFNLFYPITLTHLCKNGHKGEWVIHRDRF